jgi:hypothetical protein
MNVIDKNVDIKFVCARHVSGITFSRCTQNQKFENKVTLDALLPEAFAVIREVSVRILGLRHHDEQTYQNLSQKVN